MAEAPARPHQQRIPWYRDPKKRGILIQAIIVALTIWALATVFGNTVDNLAQRGIKTGFGFFDDVAPFSIPLNFTPFWDFVLGESDYLDVFVIGIINTLIIAIIGIPTATALGVLVGIVRLSPNWLMRKIADVYIEIFRNTPLLLQLLFWAFAVFPPLIAQLPPAKDSIIASGTVINNTGIFLPKPLLDGTSWALAAAIAVVVLAGLWALNRWQARRKDATGQQFPMGLTSCLAVVAGIVVFWFVAGDHLTFEYPEKRGLNYSGGIRPPIQLIILWFGLTLYTAAFIAENVRGGILAVSHSQSEASMALGLSRMQRLRLVILPQALRVIIPPTISQYLNLAKNSSLAVAIGYPDITNIWAGIALNQTGQSLVIIGLTILVYEILSLVTSGISNWYNKRVQIKER